MWVLMNKAIANKITTSFPAFRLPSLASSTRSTRLFYKFETYSMALEAQSQKAVLRTQEVGGHTTEFLELHSLKPSVQIVLVPGNPGAVVFYRDYVESLFKNLDGKASITAICHMAHTSEDWEAGKLYSLQEQIDHKVHFLKDLVVRADVPIVLVGHSIGAYISLELLKMFSDKVHYVLGVYPFLTLNRESLKQITIFKICLFPPMNAGLSSFAGFLGRLPRWFTLPFVKSTIGRSWGAAALESAYSHLLKYSVVHNMMHMGATEYHQLQSPPDWDFLRKNQNKICLLFGSNDHWGPLSHLKEVSKEVPSLSVVVEREGLLHDFCCNEVGSEWVARFTADVVLSAIPGL
ncbi:hypothetical protein O6H91_19G061600 [Diphasiastrum complanatum]|uniref:Uncharacterized protein n=1 Tax=Diphasiastrum complanatum TaxID=34168 RepID=A0ACC2AVU5_DIPCM|nr:hypothetical protein O6H91_19G061600 [Diphasiastrum complanatum]